MYIEDSIGATEQMLTKRNVGTVIDTLWHATLFGVMEKQPYDPLPEIPTVGGRGSLERHSSKPGCAIKLLQTGSSSCSGG